MRKIILLLVLALFVCLPVQANPVTIPGIGEINPGQNITVTEAPDKKGAINYAFKVKDGSVWHSAVVMPLKNIAPSEVNGMLKLNAFLDRMVEGGFQTKKDFLEAENAKLVSLGGKECATTSIKMDGSGVGGIILNTEIILVPGADGLKAFVFMCADSDAPFWRPIMHKIAASIP